MEVLCIIPARGGSKRIPRKNLMLVGGKPLLAHSIEHARASRRVTRTVVSTEDPEIAAVAAAYGAEVVPRPAALASDTATSESALRHVVETLEDRDGYRPDLIVFLQCTSPVRDLDDIDRAVERLLAERADSCFSACSSRSLIWRQDDEGLRPANYDYRHRLREQEMPREWIENGSIFVLRSAILRQHDNRLGGKIVIHEMDMWRSFQIDSPEEAVLCDWIIRSRQPALRLDRAPRLVVFDFDGVFTDNRVVVHQDGTEAVMCDRSDGLALGWLKARGVAMVVLSTEINSVVAARCRKLGLEYRQGLADKRAALETLLAERGIAPADVMYVGNDVNDLECLRLVGWGVAVADAYPEVREVARIWLTRRGGAGAVREIAEILLRAGNA